ncbi:MAG: DNA primase [Proteobacteria bacterium]|nr:DNA primase [Pseudomonadota bacterium]
MVFFIPEEKINEIKNAADIVDLISESVVLKKAGRNHIGLCPFHSEKTPSFTVSYEKQIFYCFGCGTGGNIFAFLMKKEGHSFPEAVKYLAGKYGVHIPDDAITPEQKQKISEKENLLSVNKQAMNFFSKCLTESNAGKKARDYLRKREISQETLRDFCLGYAPEGWNTLLNHMTKKDKHSPLLLEKAGLIIKKNDSAGFYDRFRDRIVFPIFDAGSQVIGFGGRVMDDSLPKYLNSPETVVFNKSRSLYGLNAAKSECRITETVYIVEGYFDLLALHQHGIKNCVATLGTAITPEHVKMLRGIVGKEGKFILVYDSDAAGIKAAYRSTEIFDKGYADARILVLPSGYDPDSYLVEFGAESFKNAVSGALGAVSFLINRAIKKHGMSIEGKIRIISELKKVISSVGDNIERSLYIRELAEKTDIDEAAIREKIGGATTISGSDSIPVTGNERGSRLERRIIAMMLQFPEIIPEIIKRDLLKNFTDDILKSVGYDIIRQQNLSSCHDPDMIPVFDDDEKNRIAAFLAISEDAWDRDGCMKLMAQFEDCRERQKDTSINKIKAAEEIKDNKLLLELLREKQIQARKKRSNNLIALGGETQ